jgi:hypothetical protein
MSMKSITLHSHVGADGVLELKVPIGIANADVDIVVVVGATTPAKKSPEDLGWPPGFFEETFGSIPDLERAPQGEYEIREEIE